MQWGTRADRIDHDGPRFVWEQIADDIAAEINSGALPPGSRLPAEDELARVYGVARGTIRRAIVALVEREALVVRHGRGTYVA